MFVPVSSFCFLPVSNHNLSAVSFCRKSPPSFLSLESLWTFCQTAVIWELTWATTSTTGSTAAPRLPRMSLRQQAPFLISCCSASSAATCQHAVTALSSTSSWPWTCFTRAIWFWKEETTWWFLSPSQRLDTGKNWNFKKSSFYGREASILHEHQIIENEILLIYFTPLCWWRLW